VATRWEIDESGVDELRAYVQQRLGRFAGQMIDDARRLAPVDTGALKASGRAIRMSPELWRISFGEGLPDGRAVYNELGTRYMQAQPYIRPAIYRERSL
jgi:hypothetical protein